MQDRKKIVNTEEQNRPVNPAGRSYEKEAVSKTPEHEDHVINTSGEGDPGNMAVPDTPNEENT